MSDTDQVQSPTSDDEQEAAPRPAPPDPELPSCDLCGSTDLAWLRCKLICSQCHAILMTCGDL